jgi:hypothetical protein
MAVDAVGIEQLDDSLMIEKKEREGNLLESIIPAGYNRAKHPLGLSRPTGSCLACICLLVPHFSLGPVPDPWTPDAGAASLASQLPSFPAPSRRAGSK